MTIAEMLGQSGILTLLGMGVVFFFLIILIVFMYVLHFVVHAFHLDKDLDKKEPTAVAGSVARAPVPPPAADNGAVVAAIAAAVHERQSL